MLHCVLQCSMLQWSLLQCVWSIRNRSLSLPGHVHCNKLQHTATQCNTLQHTATHCNTLQHTATHCNTRLCAYLCRDTFTACPNGAGKESGGALTKQRSNMVNVVLQFCQKVYDSTKDPCISMKETYIFAWGGVPDVSHLRVVIP